MIEVLKNNNKKYKLICPNCESILVYNKIDLQKKYVWNPSFQRRGTWTFLQCPCCLSKTMFEIDGDTVREMEEL